jgi:hypothetical protein
MGITIGSGRFVYEVAEGWGRLPDGWTYKEVAAVGVDRKDQVYVFTRGEHPIIVFDREGNFLRSWGEGLFKRAHRVTMGPDDTIYLTDDGDHTVRKCALDGKVLLTLGVPGKPAPYQSGEPFTATHVALRQKRFVRRLRQLGAYSPTASRCFLGRAGTTGQFNIVHNICADRDGYVYADRVPRAGFDASGKFEPVAACTGHALLWIRGRTRSAISATGANMSVNKR